MYQITTHSSKHGEGVYIARIRQYMQCDKGNHLTSETKPVEQFNMRADAVRALANHIYQRITGAVWDVVKDGVCITQMSGYNGVKRAVDELLESAS